MSTKLHDCHWLRMEVYGWRCTGEGVPTVRDICNDGNYHCEFMQVIVV